MNYEDSKKNIEFSKNFVMPLEGYMVIISFENEKPVWFLLPDADCGILIKSYQMKGTPLSVIYEEDEEVKLTYDDELLMYDYSFQREEVKNIFFKENLLERAFQQLAGLPLYLRK